MTSMGIGIIIYVVFFVILGSAMITLIRRSGQRYVVAGRALPFILVSATLLAQSMDANASLGNVASLHDGGFWLGFSYPLGLAICLVVVGLWYAKPLNRMKLLTLPDFYYRRYGSLVEILVALLMMFSFVILVAGNFAGGAWILSDILGISYVKCLIMLSSFIFIYTIAGGLFSVVATDIVQIYPAILAFIAAAIYMFVAYDGGAGWSTFAANIPPGYFDFSGLYSIDNGALIVWANLAALGIGDVIALDFMERVFSAKAPSTARRACFWAAGGTVIAGLACSFVGLMSFTVLKGFGGDPKDVMPLIALTKVPFMLGLFMMGGVIAAGMSTADGGILGVSTVLGRNFLLRHVYRPLWERRAKKANGGGVEWTEQVKKVADWRLLIASRIMAIPVVAAAIYMAIVKPEPGMLLVLAFDVVFAGCLVPLTLGIYWKKANMPGALAAIFVGSILRLILYFTIPEHLAGLDTLIPPVVSLLVMVPVSLMTQKSHPPRHEVVNWVPTDEEILTGVA
ncbi:MAG: hypothetical protein DRI26_09595 [Chloroflexi bacterium]|nr:MAG: hypothetical protein DRI26_09595 [Chloroflexota bacterium]